MATITRFVCIVAVLFSLPQVAYAQHESAISQSTNLLTIAERSNYTQTATYDQTMALVNALDAASDRITVTSIGKTASGRSIPMLVIAQPPVTTPTQARASDKLTVLMIGNIHAGEVCGKEALLMLARELALDPKPALLDDFILCIVPIYNADGNEHMAPGNRPGQNGPDKMGVRTNDQGLDLNRDFIKAQAPETRALLRVFRRWQPDVFIDTHTTNGSHHRYTLTYSGPKHPGGNNAILRYIRDTMLPRVSQTLATTRHFDSFPYGNFASENTRWTTFPASPRYSTNYAGMRGCFAFLSEAYSYAPFKDRVLATHDFILAVLQDLSAHNDEVVSLLTSKQEHHQTTGKNHPVRTSPQPLPGTFQVKGFVQTTQDGRSVATDQPKDYEVEVVDDFVGVVQINKPFAYILPADRTDIADLLERHGIEVDILREDIELDLESYKITDIQQQERPFQGHRLETLTTELVPQTRHVLAGSFVIKTEQALGNLAIAMLEPQAEDSLATWNFFDQNGHAPEVGSVLEYSQLDSYVPLLTAKRPPLEEDREPPQPITYERLYESENRPNLSGNPMRSVHWLDDDHYSQVRDGKTWKIEAATGRVIEQITGKDDISLYDALVALPSFDDKSARQIDDRRSFVSRASGVGIINYENDLYAVGLDGSFARRLTATPQAEELALLSPNGAYVAYVRGNNLYTVEISSGIERQLTTTGTDKIRNGKNPWIYYEEVFGRNWRSFWWSPDSQYIAYFETDSTNVDEFVIVDDAVEPQKVMKTEYPKPGSTNPDIRIGIVRAAGGSPSFVDLSEYTQGDFIVTSLGWWPDSSKIYFSVQDRAQHWLDFSTSTPSGSKPNRLLRQTTKAWVEAPSYFRFLDDQSFLITSEESGYKHLYHYKEDGTLLKQITSGPWEVRQVLQYDDHTHTIYFMTNKDSAIGTSLYSVRIDGTHLTGLTNEPGTHRTTISPHGKYVVDTWSSLEHPTHSVLRNGKDGSVVRQLDTNPVFAIDQYQLGNLQRLTIPASRSNEEHPVVLEGLLLYPPHFDKTKRYPVWFMTYAGPHAPTIRDSWQGGRLSDQMLANSGFLVLRADPYSASGKGAVSAWTAYRKLGVEEMKDIDDIINWIKALPFVDSDRIGMSGFSYGGFMTAYAMTHSNHFAAGIAGGTVTSWRDYDTIYTERYMDTPQNNPQGYDDTSVVAAAKNLHGDLLIVHGWIDDNVHTQNSVKLIKALQDADRDFEMLFYPRFAHGIWSRHYRRAMYAFQMKLVNTDAQASTKTDANQATKTKILPERPETMHQQLQPH